MAFVCSAKAIARALRRYFLPGTDIHMSHATVFAVDSYLRAEAGKMYQSGKQAKRELVIYPAFRHTSLQLICNKACSFDSMDLAALCNSLCLSWEGLLEWPSLQADAKSSSKSIGNTMPCGTHSQGQQLRASALQVSPPLATPPPGSCRLYEYRLVSNVPQCAAEQNILPVAQHLSEMQIGCQSVCISRS